MQNRLSTIARVKQTGSIEDSISEPLRASGDFETIEYVAETGCQRRESFLKHTLPDLVGRSIDSGNSIAILHIGYEPSVPHSIQTEIAAEIASVIRTSSPRARTYINVSPPDTRRTQELVGVALSEATTESTVAYIANIRTNLEKVGNKYGVEVVVGAAILHNKDNPFQGIGEECDLTTAMNRHGYTKERAQDLIGAAQERLQDSFRKPLSGVEALAGVKRYAA